MRVGLKAGEDDRKDRGPSSGVLRDVRTLYTLGTLGSLTDAELLERFLARGGDGAEDAFAALVHRHGPTVLGVAGGCSPTLTMPRTPSRRRSWSCRVGGTNRST